MMQVIQTCAEHEPKGVQIGSRWVPYRVLRIDTERGIYECLNPSIDAMTHHETLVQLAILHRPSASLLSRILRRFT